MFLKQGTFNYEKQSVVLSELSGLQRIEYLAFVQQRTAKFDAGEGELPEAERQIAFLRMGMDINAWLVSRSLWNADQSKDVETLCASVITTWSYDALGAGAEMVLSLSGMGAIDNAGDDEHEALTPEKSRRGKCSLSCGLPGSSGGQTGGGCCRKCRPLSLVSGAIISGCRASVMCGWMRSLPR